MRGKLTRKTGKTPLKGRRRRRNGRNPRVARTCLHCLAKTSPLSLFPSPNHVLTPSRSKPIAGLGRFMTLAIEAECSISQGLPQATINEASAGRSPGTKCTHPVIFFKKRRSLVSSETAAAGGAQGKAKWRKSKPRTPRHRFSRPQ